MSQEQLTNECLLGFLISISFYQGVLSLEIQCQHVFMYIIMYVAIHHDGIHGIIYSGNKLVYKKYMATCESRTGDEIVI